ncbi:hypothetical protein [Actinokineospora sp. NBRC 105648]|uniref:hypothetical protein n=1 Tax=Actinokineospora sp. NBRC 105648 TaxID=3032206 RepID=UPI0024A5E0AB|nr:hypothetical protein [Actinokineospora sp. NBRC 105648]GLZ41690.1 hypothetical protein Acsp05_53140 [Actinokineospora sp. NBRC 105648]
MPFLGPPPGSPPHFPPIPPAQAEVLQPAPLSGYGAEGFGPTGSGGYSQGTTPVPPRPPVDELPVVKEPRKRPSYLVEGDDDEMFGNAAFTAPPVIGE